MANVNDVKAKIKELQEKIAIYQGFLLTGDDYACRETWRNLKADAERRLAQWQLVYDIYEIMAKAKDRLGKGDSIHCFADDFYVDVVYHDKDEVCYSLSVLKEELEGNENG